MNAKDLEPVRWTRRRWIYAVAAAFAVQALFVFSLGSRTRPAPQRPQFPTAIQLVGEGWTARHATDVLQFDDPTLLALPNLHGFSGSAWLRFPPLEYQPGEWSDSPHWIELDSAMLGGVFSHFVASSSVRPPLVADKPLPTLQRYEPNFPNEPVPARSRLRVEGPLAGRPLLTMPELPSWAHSELVSNSVVRVAVSRDGCTFSPLLLTESGYPEADLRALKIANELRFLPATNDGPTGQSPDAMTWGKLFFQWHTLPSPLADVPSATP
jgi:hypothetical protein